MILSSSTVTNFKSFCQSSLCSLKLCAYQPVNTATLMVWGHFKLIYSKLNSSSSPFLQPLLPRCSLLPTPETSVLLDPFLSRHSHIRSKIKSCLTYLLTIFHIFLFTQWPHLCPIQIYPIYSVTKTVFYLAYLQLFPQVILHQEA